MYRAAPLGFSSRDGQVESTPYTPSQAELQQRQTAERIAQAEQAIMQAARELHAQKEAQQLREMQERQPNPNIGQQRETNIPVEEKQGRDRYVEELFRLTAPAATQKADTPHPELSGATAGNIHSSATLMGRNWAAEQNAKQSDEEIPIYHKDGPIIQYNTDIPTARQPEIDPTSMARVHHGNIVGSYATNLRDIDYGYIDGEEARKRLSLPEDGSPPTHFVDVYLPIGTLVEASRPESDLARQYIISTKKVLSWFINSRKLD